MKEEEQKDTYLNGKGFLQCSCHNSIEEHFQEIVNEDGYSVAKCAYKNMIESYLHTERQLMLAIFDKMINKEQ